MKFFEYKCLKDMVNDSEDFKDFEVGLEKFFGRRLIEEEKFSRAIKNIAYLALKRWPDKKVDITKGLTKYVSSKTASQLIVETGARSGFLSDIASFREAIAQRSIKRSQLETRHSCFEWELDDKVKSYSFIDELNVKRPELYSYGVSIKDLDLRVPCVVKPVSGAGSNGVYLVFSEDNILKVKTSERISGIGKLKSNLYKDIATKSVNGDKWIIEQLIGSDENPPIDIKFITFYGDIQLVWEISRNPKLSSRWSDSEGNTVDSGISLYKEPYMGKGATPAQLAIAKSISLEIPAPFMRIDFILSNGELYFGEFTPRPGSYADFSSSIDRKLGLAYLKAEARLMNDMFKGKEFTAFKKYMSGPG